jgi:hypothetical protein
MALLINGTEHLDLVEAARLLKIHPESLRRLARYGDIDALKVERGLYFPKQSLVERLYQRSAE